MDEDGPLEPPPRSEPTAHINGWCPLLNPTQQKVFDCTCKFILEYGEKGSGKSIGGIMALIRHCYEEEDALALVIAPQIRTGSEGVMYDLVWALDIWKNGNFDPADPERKRRIDEGIEGFNYTQPALDAQTKDRCLFIQNKWGGWSKVLLMSIPYAEVVQKRMKALSPSFIYVDEITELESKEFFTYVAQQLGRRRDIRGPQQYIASCNPEGPSHWVYQVFWEDCVDKDTGVRDARYEVFHVPVSENKHNLPANYVEDLVALYKDPLDADRLLRGIWVDRPTGDAIFKNFFLPEIHIRPHLKSSEYRNGQGLLPLKQFPIILGWDPGAVNYSVTYEQMIPTKDKVIWITFDEINFVGKYMPDYRVVPAVLKKMNYWQTFLGSQARFIHIADQSSFNQLRPNGTYDATRVRELSNRRINLRECPKGKESVPARVQMARTMFMDETAFVSAQCPGTWKMFQLLESEKQKPNAKYDELAGLRPRRCVYIHPFDSWSYPPYYFTLHPARFGAQTGKVDSPGVFSAGQG